MYMKHILFTGGGSAGHVVPNLALMHELRYSHRVTYMGTCGIEKELVGRAGYPFFTVETPKLVRSFTLENLKIPFRLSRAKRRAEEILSAEKPDLIFSKGGFVSYPAVCAAHKLGIPILTHESDLSPGLCTKLIAKKCGHVLTSFPETASLFKNGMHTGSPIRREILSGDRARARKKFGFDEKKPVLLVLGGGSGSRMLNEAVRGSLENILKRLYVLHLCGRGNAMNDPPEGYVQREYESDMGSAYACADLVLSRAGSNTVFEILALKKPALLVPLGHSSRGDQIENAAYFAERGLCRVLYEEELGALTNRLFDLLSDDALRAALTACTLTNGAENILSAIRDALGE